jgi:hypothetical protein
VTADDRYLYVAAAVRDDTVRVHSLREICEQDGLEFVLDPRPREVRSGEGRFRPVTISFAPAGDGAGQRLEISGMDTAGVRSGSRRTDDGYTFECALPLPSVARVAGGTVREFRMNASLFDHDGDESQYRGTHIRWMPEWGGDGDMAGSGSFRLFLPGTRDRK